MISSPERKDSGTVDPHAHYPESEMPFFVEVINIDALQETHETPSVPHEIYVYAKQWFEENSVPLTLLSLGMPPTSKPSSGDSKIDQVDDEIFLKFFKGLVLLTALYYTYQFATSIFKSSPPVPKAILVE